MAYISHFCKRKPHRTAPSPIDSPRTSAAALALVIALFALAPHAGAFWPFYTANAQTPSVIPSSATPALAAAINPDPNPDKGIAAATDLSGGALVADAGPEGTAANLASSTAAGQISTYIVKEGDTLSQIAQLYGVSVNTLIWANGLAGKTIHTGEVLVVLPVSGVKVTVESGDTLASLARKYHGDAQDIADYNGLDASAALAVGSTVIIPNGELSGVTSLPRSGNTTGNPYRGGSGALLSDYYLDPMPGGLLSQGLHGENAVDIAGPRGSEVLAAADGIVIVARDNGAYNGGYGNYVVIAHDNGTQTLYAHMITGSISVSIGETVAQGETLGREGATGDATGPHVHFEIRGAANPFALCPSHSVVPEFGCGQ